MVEFGEQMKGAPPSLKLSKQERGAACSYTKSVWWSFLKPSRTTCWIWTGGIYWVSSIRSRQIWEANEMSSNWGRKTGMSATPSVIKDLEELNSGLLFLKSLWYMVYQGLQLMITLIINVFEDHFLDWLVVCSVKYQDNWEKRQSVFPKARDGVIYCLVWSVNRH